MSWREKRENEKVVTSGLIHSGLQLEDDKDIEMYRLASSTTNSHPLSGNPNMSSHLERSFSTATISRFALLSANASSGCVIVV